MPTFANKSFANNSKEYDMRICYVVAMVAEAKPFIERYGIQLVEDFFSPLPCQLYEGEVNGATLNVVLNGQQQGSDLIGC